MTAYVLPQLAGNLPSCPIPQQFIRDLPELPLADPKFYESAQIDILVGADVLPPILLSGTRPNIWLSPRSRNHFRVHPNRFPFFPHESHTTVDTSLDRLLSKFWEVEDKIF